MAQNKKTKDTNNKPKVKKDSTPKAKATSPKAKKPAPVNSYSAERRLCDIWLENKTINPETGRAIQKDKGVYNKYAKMCISFKDPIQSKDKSKKVNSEKDMCKQWLLDRNTNPTTGRKIKTDGPVYTRISKQCFGI
jgi:hypothetical protein